MVDPFLRDNPTPPPTPTSPVQPTPAAPVAPNPGNPIAKGSRVGLKTFLLGCVGFGIIIIGLAAIVLYLMIQNPDQYASIGLDRNTIQVLLQTFALLFFGFVFFLGFGILLVNGYRYISVKNKPRISYLVLTIVGFFIVLFSIAIGATVLTRIANLEVNRGIDATSLVAPYLVLQTGPTNILTNPSLQLIAPATMVFQINQVALNRQILPLLGPVDIQSISMTCGNGSSLVLAANGTFNGDCYYASKGSYPVVLTINYINRQTAETRTSSYEVGNLQFVSQIDVRIQDGVVIQGSRELVAGKAPRKITFDAAAVFRDLQLSDYRIIWDVDGDGVTDAENVSDVIHIYNDPRLYNVVVRFPELNTFAYTFPLRIEQPDVPICILSASQLQGTTYKIQADMTGRTARIDGYNFSIIDIVDNRKIVATQRATTNAIDYNFPGQGLYAVKLDFVTSDGRQGSCESQNITVGQADFTINYDIFYRSPTVPTFMKVDASSSVLFDGSQLIVNELPTIIQLRITDIQPVSATMDVAVFLNDAAILSLDDKVFEMRINQPQGDIISIVVTDSVRSAQTEQKLLVQVEQPILIGNLQVKPDFVGTDPFVVTFDASTTRLNDESDEIVYFSWDFGDGILKPNVSQSVIEHTYRYDYTNENGTFSPSVLITTKKGRTILVKPSTDISVKKAFQDATIRIDSHPAQIAAVGETVSFSLDITGLPRAIVWDFGNGNTIECPGRQCTSTSQVFTESKDYTIRATVEYDNQPSIVGRIVLKVQ